jgi:excisionase family DNA binding protein
MMNTANANPGSQLMSTRAASELLNVSVGTLRRWGDQGKIDCWRISTRGDRRFKREDVERLAWKLFKGSRCRGQIAAQ